MTDAVQAVLEGYPQARRDALIPILQAVQAKEGYLSTEAVIAVGQHLKLPTSKIYGVATFYNQFRLTPPGRHHVQVCRGTACHVKGSAAVLSGIQRALKIEPDQTSKDGEYSLEVVACIGACGLAPVVAIDGAFFGDVKAEDAAALLARAREMEVGDE
ncbi:NADH-quinone oxidoreductase subunit NuoE [Myxococcota bacterium]|nr:NADH-quinone oxidoreductase subunit NuoE [Myxococcota bacterium]MBU1429300.1 NADH-quinone oxidoreductase subunit NuoE [Myxococcota bacterium]MBU1899314.1 NADH-quinone oxidoreductase subunit NuoE [Myxococcota bacterium]